MMNARPSSIGEILDRAIAIYVPRCLPLFIILAIVALPIALIQSAASPGFSHTIDLFQQLSKVPPGHPAETSRIMQRIQHDLGRHDRDSDAGLYRARRADGARE